MSDYQFSFLFKNTDTINKFLSNYQLLEKWQLGSTMAICVHSSIFERFIEIAALYCKENFIDQWYDYELTVDTTTYDMKLVYVRCHNEEIKSFLINFLTIKHSFVFNTFTNLFINESCYHMLQAFIRINYPEENIDVQIRSGFCMDEFGNTNITVVTFKEREFDWNIPTEFEDFLYEKFRTKIYYGKYYYQTFAFPWLQPSRLTHFERPIPDKSYFIIHQFLTCLREVSYGKEPHANVLDLCSLRLAFCDERGMNEYDEDLAFEIDSLIIRSLKYLKANTNIFEDNSFNVVLYAAERYIHSTLDYVTVAYFQYKFNNYFDSIGMLIGYSDLSIENWAKPDNNPKHVKLREDPELKIVTQMTTTVFNVDINDSIKMDIYTIFNIIKHRNVESVVLDANRDWFDTEQPTYLLLISWILAILGCNNKHIVLDSITENFGNKFLSALKNFPIWPSLQLIMDVPLQNYCVFDKTKFSAIIFYEMRINTMMLQQLHSCNLNSTELIIDRCHLQNEAASWDLIFAMENLDKIMIFQEELTWPSLFEFLSNKFIESHLNEFTFTKSQFVILKPVLEPGINLLLYRVERKMDSNNSKIVLVKKDSKEEIDLYYLTNGIFDDKSEYDFYN